MLCPKCKSNNSFKRENDPNFTVFICYCCGYAVYVFHEKLASKGLFSRLRKSGDPKPQKENKKKTRIIDCLCYKMLGGEPCGRKVKSSHQSTMYHPYCRKAVKRKYQEWYRDDKRKNKKEAL